MSTKKNVYSSLKTKLKMKFIGNEEELSDITKQNDDNNNVIEYKIIIVGSNLTGKTSFCNRFILDQFDLEIEPSTETTCYIKTIILFEKEIKLYLLDIETIPITPLTESEEKELYNDINGIILIFN